MPSKPTEAASAQAPTLTGELTYAPEPVQNPNEAIVKLDTPIKRGETTIDSITLRKPASGALRGVTLSDLAHMDVIALRKVLPRITTPSLTEPEVSNMDPADLMACGLEVCSFLLQKSAKEAALVA